MEDEEVIYNFIEGQCAILKDQYGYVSLNYIERSPDTRYSDNEVDITLDKKDAIDIVKCLIKEFDIKKEELC